jgi:Ser/Thr protein kinase RdoA (MazF antagonist)
MKANVSKIWKIEGKDEKWILKQYPDWFSQKDIIFIHNFINKLKSHNFPVSKIKKTNKNKGIIKLKDDLYTLMEYIEGETIDPKNSNQLKRSGAFLAKFHETSMKINLKGDRNWWKVDSYKFNEYLEEAGELSLKNKAFYTKNIDVLKVAMKKIESLLLNNNIYKKLNKLTIHGDFHPKNLKITPDSNLKTFDLDNSRKEIIEMDISKALLRFCFNQKNWQQNTTKFLNSYLENIKYMSINKRAVLSCLLIQPLQEGFWQLRQYLKTDLDSHRKNTVNHIKEIKWLLNKEKELMKLLP